ncbi:RING finger [Aspergillus fumigatus]
MSDTATGGHGDVRAHPMLMEQNHGWRMVRLSNTWALVYLGQTASTVIYYRGCRDCDGSSIKFSSSGDSARTSASTVVKETKQHSDTEMLQKLESICPTKPYDEWVEHTQTEQDLSDRSSAHFTCSMCLEDVNGTDLMHVLSCRHVYHAHCLEQWFLGRHFSCPLCNRSFFEEVEPGPEPGPDNV